MLNIIKTVCEMKIYKNSNPGWRNGSVRKKFYHSESFDYSDTKEEGTTSKERNEKVDSGSKYSFVVPWQMD